MQGKSFIMPAGYPQGCSDKDISTVITQCSQMMIDSGADINQTLRLGPIISAGQIELQRRITEKDLNETKELREQISKLKSVSTENAKSSKSFAITSNRMSKAAIGIALVTLMATLGFAVADYKSSNNWQTQQLNILKEVRDKK